MDTHLHPLKSATQLALVQLVLPFLINKRRNAEVRLRHHCFKNKKQKTMHIPLPSSTCISSGTSNTVCTCTACWCFHAWITEEQLQIIIKLLFNILINLYTYLHPLQSVLAVKLPIQPALVEMVLPSLIEKTI